LRTKNRMPILPSSNRIFAIVTSDKKIKSVRNEQGPDAKLGKYFNITTVRYCLVSCPLMDL